MFKKKRDRLFKKKKETNQQIHTLQSCHFCCVLVCLALCFLSKLIFLLLFSMPHLSILLYPQPLHWAFFSFLPSLIPSPSPRILSFCIFLCLHTVGAAEGRNQHFFPIPLPVAPTPPIIRLHLHYFWVYTRSVVLFSFSCWLLSFICSSAKWQ